MMCIYKILYARIALRIEEIDHPSSLAVPGLGLEQSLLEAAKKQAEGNYIYSYIFIAHNKRCIYC